MSISHHQPTRYNTSMLSPTLLLVSTTILSASIAVTLYALPPTNISNSIPYLYDVVVSWLKPPYLYILINFIIMTIVASSKIQSKYEHLSTSKVHESYVQIQPLPSSQVHESYVQTQPLLSSQVHQSYIPIQPMLNTPQFEDVFPNNLNLNDDVLIKNDQFISSGIATSASPLPQFDELFSYHSNNDVVLMENSQNNFTETATSSPPLHTAAEPLSPVVEQFGKFGHVDARVSETETEFMVDTGVEGSNEVVISKSAWGTPVSHRGTAEKPPVSTRFGHHRRIVKASPEGGKGALRVSKPRKQDTLETTWKTITEGHRMPLTRHLKKSDTWETHGRHHHHNVDNDEVQKMTKSETFSEGSKAGPPLRRTYTPSKLKKEPSLGQDELNKRVEAFIRKFNEDMRLQRQESLNQYKEMINRGAH